VRLAARYLRQDEVEDVVQEALLRAWRHRSAVRDPARTSEWLATIVRREAFRLRQRPRPDPRPDIGLDIGLEDAEITSMPLRADVSAALHRLGAEDRTLLRLRYAEDLTEAAIASEMDLPLGTVKVRLHRARGKLRRTLSTWR